MSHSDYILALLRQRVAEQQARWQETIAGHQMTWQAADQMIDAGRRAVVELEVYANPKPPKRHKAAQPAATGPKPQTQAERDLLHKLGF